MTLHGLLQAIRSELERAEGPLLARELAATLRRRGFVGLGRREVEGLLVSGAIRGESGVTLVDVTITQNACVELSCPIPSVWQATWPPTPSTPTRPGPALWTGT